MNGHGGRGVQPFREGGPYVPMRRQEMDICVSLKMHFQQRIAFMFGPQRLAKINASNKPFILPLNNHAVSFDVMIFFLLSICMLCPF